jgi:DUF971 family protein
MTPDQLPRNLGACVLQALAPDGLHVTWSDGHASVYPVPMLRDLCPCAVCKEKKPEPTPARGSGTALKMFVPAVELASLRAIGRYAVGFEFSDGHGTGIYSFDYLRSICPCAQCRGAR